ncbi:hypothetical protein U2F10_15850 [Leptothoe sp. EHU-05/26/07-4]
MMPKTGFVAIPDEDHYWLANGRIPVCFLENDTDLKPMPSLQAVPHQEDLVAVDVEVRGERSQVSGQRTQQISPPNRP